MKDRLAALFLFLTFFGLYVFTAAPHLAPYRDAGEMVTVLHTLGVAHPPGYPLYTLIGKVASLFPFGNFSYQINLFSGLCAALALVVFFWTLKTWTSPIVSMACIAFVGVSHPFWELAVVSEMYSLGVLWLAMLFYVYFVVKNSPFFFFLLGLGLGVRMDLLLLIPIFAFWMWRQNRLPKFACGVTFLLGASIYLYLTVRSAADPWIDWGNPETLMATFASATRKSYSGTLDLLSLSYKKGENFGVNMGLFMTHVKNTWGWVGSALLLWGVWSSLRKNRSESFLVLTVWVVMGPVFLFLANMPPNPHSVAIVEASYLFPLVVMVFFLAWGVQGVLDVRWRTAATVLLLLTLPFEVIQGYHRSSKRDNYFVRDFLTNVWRSVPNNAAIVFHDDVQLFSLWTSQLLDKKRPDVRLIATGLSSSPWYWDMLARWPVKRGEPVSLKESQGWQQLIDSSLPSPVVAGYDIEFDKVAPFFLSPQGFLVEVSKNKKEKSGTPVMNVLKHFGLYRSRAMYGETPDFFSTDLIGDQARAHHQQAFHLMLAKDNAAAWYFERSGYLDDTFVRSWADLGYYFYELGRWPDAEKTYEKALVGFRTVLDMAIRYKSLPDVVMGIRSDYAISLTHMGVVQEKLGRPEDARRYYEESLQASPNAQAHFNLAVTYWGKDWMRVVQHLEAALRLNPQMPGAMQYLEKARQMIRHE